MTMKKDERMAALNELARRNPRIKPIGGSWPNPFDGKTHRWTNADLELFKAFQSKHGGRRSKSKSKSKSRRRQSRRSRK